MQIELVKKVYLIPGLIRYPLFIDVLIHPGHYPQNLSGSVRDHNVASDTVHHVNSLSLPGLPGASHEGVRLTVGHRLIHHSFIIQVKNVWLHYRKMRHTQKTQMEKNLIATGMF